jgi:peptidoglycan/LPS O-acetylase OafA/YrhL
VIRRTVVVLVSLVLALPVGFVVTAPPAVASCAPSTDPCCDSFVGPDSDSAACREAYYRLHPEGSDNSWLAWIAIGLGVVALGITVVLVARRSGTGRGRSIASEPN